jgi:hypothetical protein
LIEPAGEMWSVVILSPKEAEDAGALDVLEAGTGLAHAHEVGRVLDIGRVVVPGVGLAGGALNGLPVLVALEHVGILRLIEFARDVLQR